MARFTRMQVLNTMIAQGLVPVFYHPDLEIAKEVAQACYQGGGRLLEFTNRGDFAPQVFSELNRWAGETLPEMILGVGSVVDAPTAALYLANGANFVVGPVLNPEVARLCNRRKVAYSPGCGSASEISQAEELGVEIVKIFPGGSVGGPGFIKSILGPCPWTRIMPTGGVDASLESIQAWMRAGATCLGMGSKLITKELVAAQDWDGLAEQISLALRWIQEANSK